MRTYTPVILQAALKEALKDGGTALAHCTEDAKKIGSAWTGSWTVYLLADGERVPLVNHRALQTREFKTIAGLISLATELGLEAANIPLRQGTSVSWTHGTEANPQS